MNKEELVEVSFEEYRDHTYIKNTVNGINSIATLYKSFRNKSKAPTFLLTYRGTSFGLMRNLGFDQQEAKQIEDNYHQLYVKSDKWIEAEIAKIQKQGFAELAFGLQLKAPMLSSSILGTRVTPKQSHQEMKTIGNAKGQSYGLLNNRASLEFLDKVIKAGYGCFIKPIIHIHDAQYYLIKEDSEILEFTNNELTKAFTWQEDPNIKHDQVHLEGDLEVFYPHWGKGHVLKNPTKEKVNKQYIKDFMKCLR